MTTILDSIFERDARRRRERAVAAARCTAAALTAVGDLLVVTCPPALRYAIEGMVEEEAGGLPFDVIHLDEVAPARRERLLSEARRASDLR